MQFLVLILLLLSGSGSAYKSFDPKPFCKPTTKSIDLKASSTDFFDHISKNYLNLLSKQNDQFNYVYLSHNARTIVYTLNGVVYSTDCKSISNLSFILTFN